MNPDEILSALCLEEDDEEEEHKLWSKYQHQLEMPNDASLLPCTKCKALIFSTPDNAALLCPCGHEFCAIHGDAHPHIMYKSMDHFHLVKMMPFPNPLIPRQQNHVLIVMFGLNCMKDVNTLYVLLVTKIGATSVDSMNT